jgi:hypothetical protein
MRAQSGDQVRTNACSLSDALVLGDSLMTRGEAGSAKRFSR